MRPSRMRPPRAASTALEEVESEVRRPSSRSWRKRTRRVCAWAKELWLKQSRSGVGLPAREAGRGREYAHAGGSTIQGKAILPLSSSGANGAWATSAKPPG